ncbi:hypothetical protein ACFL3F_00410 [Planctomycetota bacterium]
MNDTQIVEVLLELLETSGVEVRHASLEGRGGGICSVGDRRVFFVDTQSPIVEQRAVCAAAVAEVVDLEHVYVRPQVRDFIESDSSEDW